MMKSVILSILFLVIGLFAGMSVNRSFALWTYSADIVPDGIVDFRDYNVLVSQYGKTVPGYPSPDPDDPQSPPAAPEIDDDILPLP